MHGLCADNEESKNMARTKANLKILNITNDYDKLHYDWSEEECTSLADCRATAEVIKKRLESHELKIQEMYVIEHKSENGWNHYHILAKLEGEGATLEDIARYLGMMPEMIEKPKPGRYTYENMLAYLIHIKDADKIQYSPDDVITLVGKSYSEYYTERYEKWLEGREKKKKAEPINNVFKEAMKKIENYEIKYSELATVEKYRKLILDKRYRKKLKDLQDGVDELAEQDYRNVLKKIEKKEITTLEEVLSDEKYRLAYENYDWIKYGIHNELRIKR